jgi:transcriptional regulator with XRE-family HTH domain
MANNTVRPSAATVRAHRRRLGWSQQALADRCEQLVMENGAGPQRLDPVSLRTLQKLEAGQPVFPGTLKTVALALKVAVADLLAPGQAPADADDSSPAPLLTVHLDVRVWGSGSGNRRDLSIHQPGVLPLHTGEKLRVVVEASRPTHLFLVWITSRGEAQPLYPWEEFDWRKPLVIGRVDRLSLPMPEAVFPVGGWPIDTPAGLETLVLMACEDTPVADAAAKVAALWRGFPAGALAPDPGQAYWFECRRGEQGDGGGTRLRPAEPIGDPVHEIQALLRERLTGRFDLVCAVSLANAGSAGIAG